MELSLRRIEETPSTLRRGSDFLSSFERMSRLFDDVFGESLLTYVMPETRGTFSPRTDIKETDKSFVISAEMPGIDKEDIEVSVHDGMLTISGEKKVEQEDKGADYHHVERSYGCFSRSIELPDTVDSEKLEAVHRNGVLTITLPKTEKAISQVKKIPVKSA